MQYNSYALNITQLIKMITSVIGNHAYMRTGRGRQPTLNSNVTASATTFQDSQKLNEVIENLDLPFFDISTILAATDNFSFAKRLGQGGFGPVYKVLHLANDKHLLNVNQFLFMFHNNFIYLGPRLRWIS